MTLTRGGCLRRTESGMAGLAVILILMLSLSAAVLLAPNLVVKASETRRAAEDERLRHFADAMFTSIRQTGRIPSATNWAATVGEQLGLGRTNILSVWPEFPTDTSVHRVLLIDPGLGAGVLPFVQGEAGLFGAATNLNSDLGRMLLVSSTRRGLALPYTNGQVLTTTAFNNLWNWGLNPSTKAPPTGWPAAWNGRAVELHAQRIRLSELFHTVSLKNVLFQIETNAPAILTVGVTNITLIDSTLIKVFETNGTMVTAQRLTKDFQVDRTTTNNATAVIHYMFSELSGLTATNSGTYGMLWNGLYTNGVTLGRTPLRPPSYPGFPTNNYSAWFDGARSMVDTGRRLTNYLPQFSFAAWIAPEDFRTYTMYVAGVRGSLSMNIYKSSRTGSNFVRLSTYRGGSIAVHYPYTLGQWRHIAFTGNGTSLRAYVDGEFKKSYSKVTLNYYYSNAYVFRVAANPAISKGKESWGTYAHFKGGMDDVIFYDRVLTTNEIKSLARGVVP